MPTVDEYKIDILRQLAQLTVQGREPVLPLRTTPVDEAIRAVAELKVQGNFVFEDDARACLLTEHSERVVDRVIAELELKQQRKGSVKEPETCRPPIPLGPLPVDSRLVRQ